MTKLKFDRSINMGIKRGESVTVPDDDVWKVTGLPVSKLKINEIRASLFKDAVTPFAYTLGGVLK